MNLGHCAYLVTIFLFSGGAFFIEILLAGRKLWRYRRLLLLLTILTTMWGVSGDFVALQWGAWQYNPERTFGVIFITEVETYLYCAFVALSVISAALIWGEYEERGLSPMKTTWEKLRKRLW